MAYIYQVDKTLVSDQYTVTFSLVSITDSDVNLMDKFGAPKVDFGGSFTGSPTFTLSTNQRSLKTGLPVSQTFDKNSDADAETKANAFEAQCKTRIAAALTALRANSDSFTTSEEIEV